MHPLFLSHLLGDFLLQPTALVHWKERSVKGIAVHASVHGLTMFLLCMPTTWRAAAAILAVMVAHGVIDHIKVMKQRYTKSFELGFLADQLAHFLCIVAAVRFGVKAPTFWLGEQGAIVAGVLLFLTFGNGLFNLMRLPKFPLKTAASKVGRVALVTAPFALFIAGAAWSL